MLAPEQGFFNKIDVKRTSRIAMLDLAGGGRLRRLHVDAPEMFVNLAGTGPALIPPAARLARVVEHGRKTRRMFDQPFDRELGI